MPYEAISHDIRGQVGGGDPEPARPADRPELRRDAHAAHDAAWACAKESLAGFREKRKGAYTGS